jgi:hypothetical protein
VGQRQASVGQIFIYCFLARWARRLSWKETAEAFRTSWEKVFDAVEHVVTFGLEHRTLGPMGAIGVDEIQYAKGQYLTLVYKIDVGVTRLLWVRKEPSSRFRDSSQSSEMNWPQRSCLFAPTCDSLILHIFDRFLIVAKMNRVPSELSEDGGPPCITAMNTSKDPLTLYPGCSVLTRSTDSAYGLFNLPRPFLLETDNPNLRGNDVFRETPFDVFNDTFGGLRQLCPV